MAIECTHAILAMAPQPGQNGQGPSSGFFFGWMAIMMAIFYVMIIRPQRRKYKDRTAEQRQVLKYFQDTGCLASLSNMRDDAYDRMVLATLNGKNLKAVALGKIGLDEDQVKEIEPIFIHGYNYDSDALSKICSDGRSRSSKYDATWLFFSDTHVYMYAHTFDMTSGTKREKTEEYFYKDITNFSTSIDTVEIAQIGGCNRAKADKTSVEISRFALVVPGDKFSCSTSGVSDAERSVSAMKQKLREKKQQ